MPPLPIPFNFGRGKARIDELAEMFNTTAELTTAVLRVIGVTTDAQTVTVGSDVLEIDTIGTAITPTLTVADGLITTLTLTAHGIIAADILNANGHLPIKCESEIIHVVEVVDVNTVKTKRGRSGTTAVLHSAAAVTKAAITAGRHAIGVLSTSVDDFLTAIEAEVNAGDRFSDGGIAPFFANKNLTLDVLVLVPKVGRGTRYNGRATTETMANASFDAATMGGGIAPARRRNHAVSIVPTAGEVTAGFIVRALEMAPTGYFAPVVRTTATGVIKARTAMVLTPRSGNKPAFIQLSNAGSVDRDVNDTISLLLTE